MERVPVIDVTKENFKLLWPCLLCATKSSSFIALDLELSGIGNRKETAAKSVEDRYKALVEVAKTRAIISFGISCFTPKKDEEGAKTLSYTVRTFNLLVLCTENYTVEPESLKFLVDHGFDFNRQYSSGLPYYRGDDKVEKGTSHQNLRQLFVELLTSKRPVVLHNGLVDLVFLYQNLYNNLPNTLASFLADLSEIFTAGIYDTKYITEFHARHHASYLEYVFRKQQRINAENKFNLARFVSVDFPSFPDAVNVEYRNCVLRKGKGSTDVCTNYGQHGWCSKGNVCQLSHDIDDILDAEISKRKKKGKRRKNSNSTVELMDIIESSEEQNDDPSNDTTPGGHRAGYDAFMTGFAFSTFLLKFGNDLEIKECELTEFKNKVYLCGKDAPLLVMCSQFGKPSVAHKNKWNIINSL